MEERRKRPSRVWIVVALLATPLLYVLSIGPACWLMSRIGGVGIGFANVIYRPVLWHCEYGPDPIPYFFDRYVRVGMTGDSMFYVVGLRLKFYELDPFE